MNKKDFLIYLFATIAVIVAIIGSVPVDYNKSRAEIYTNINGSWKNVTDVKENINGTWIQGPYGKYWAEINKDGSWKSIK
ncbi:MAG: hypothetical protein ABSB18_06410 [Candidatus Omnitrophota bacterium]